MQFNLRSSLRRYTLWRGGPFGSPRLANTFGWMYLARLEDDHAVCKVGFSLDLVRRSRELKQFNMVWVWSLPLPQTFESRVVSWMREFNLQGTPGLPPGLPHPTECYRLPVSVLFGVIRLAIVYVGFEKGYLVDRRVPPLTLKGLKCTKVVDGEVPLWGNGNSILDVGVLRRMGISPNFPDARIARQPASGEHLFCKGDNVYGLYEGTWYPCQVREYYAESGYEVWWYEENNLLPKREKRGKDGFVYLRNRGNNVGETLHAWEVTSMRVVQRSEWQNYPEFMTIEVLRF